jgi:cytochrome c oxidase cbb3-type subunit 3
MNCDTKNIFLAASVSVAATLLMFPHMLAQNPQPPAAAAARARASVTVGSQGPLPEHAKFTNEQVDAGNTLFIQNCAFCHGKEAGGGESGPDLTRSKVVSSDKNGESVGPVVRGGRPDKGMPSFGSLGDAQILNLVAFIHAKQDAALSESGNRRGVEDSDLQTGNAAAGKQYFEGAGGCSKCHSATGDLAGIATKYTGLRLEMQMLYPRDVKEKVSVKTPSGETLNGVVEYQDEFTIGMRDSHGTYHSWPVNKITFKVDDPLKAHEDAFSKYTDEDIHNVLAYMQTLK